MASPLRSVATPWRSCVAPMVDRTDRHFRAMFRGISRHALLFTPTVAAHAILHGKADADLDHDPLEHPLAIQLGGCDPQALPAATRWTDPRASARVEAPPLGAH